MAVLWRWKGPPRPGEGTPGHPVPIQKAPTDPCPGAVRSSRTRILEGLRGMAPTCPIIWRWRMWITAGPRRRTAIAMARRPTTAPVRRTGRRTATRRWGRTPSRRPGSCDRVRTTWRRRPGPRAPPRSPRNSSKVCTGCPVMGPRPPRRARASTTRSTWRSLRISQLLNTFRRRTSRSRSRPTMGQRPTRHRTHRTRTPPPLAPLTRRRILTRLGIVTRFIPGLSLDMAEYSRTDFLAVSSWFFKFYILNSCTNNDHNMSIL